MKRGPEVNNIDSMRQDSTLPEPPNNDKQPSSPRPHNPPKKPKYEIRQLSATLQLNRKDKMLYVPLQVREYEKFGLLDTGAIQSALSEAELRRSLSAHPAALLQGLHAQSSKSTSPMAASSPSKSRCYYDSSLAAKSSKKHSWFSQLWEMYSSECHSSRSIQTLDLANNIVRSPDITL